MALELEFALFVSDLALDVPVADRFADDESEPGVTTSGFGFFLRSVPMLSLLRESVLYQPDPLNAIAGAFS
ncbi:MAG TPA: hypothetical protein QF624_10945 [Dehalococcoidia bacterium]|nr:hypothetical protein [Dehalococcoidia bacterium]